MRRILALPSIVLLMALVSAAMYVPALHALSLRDFSSARAFFYGGTLGLILSAMIGIATINRPPQTEARAILGVLLSAYVVVPLMAAVPFAAAVHDTTFFNAWFEMVSDFTTTGATLYTGPGQLPASVHLWRALMGWLGGFFTLVSALAVLQPLNLGGFEVVSGGRVGRGARGASQITRIADPAERIARHATMLFPVYGGLTLALWLGLLVAGDTSLVALIHAMSTLSTSGISPVGGLVGAHAGLAGEIMIFFFLFFAISRFTWPGVAPIDRRATLLEDPEFRLGLSVVLIVSAFLFLRHWQALYDPDSPGSWRAAISAFWADAFTTLSFLSTTGFQSAGWGAAQGWSGLHAPGLLLVSLALMGGGVATTAGGVKLLRFHALYKHSIREMEKLVHPHSVGGAGSLARRLRREGAHLAFIFFMLFGMAMTLVMAALTLTGLRFEPALIFAAAALSTTGPLVEVATKVPLHYTDLGLAGKAILMLAMVLGRLETLAIIALFLPDGWGGRGRRGI